MNGRKKSRKRIGSGIDIRLAQSQNYFKLFDTYSVWTGSLLVIATLLLRPLKSIILVLLFISDLKYFALKELF